MEQSIVVDSEVVGGRGESRRRWRTVEEKRRIVEEAMAPGASVAQVARLHGVNANQVFLWRRQYQAGDLAAPGSDGPKLLPVIVSDPVQDVAAEESLHNSLQLISLRLATSHLLRATDDIRSLHEQDL